MRSLEKLTGLRGGSPGIVTVVTLILLLAMIIAVAVAAIFGGAIACVLLL